jgi:hypothetical protein
MMLDGFIQTYTMPDFAEKKQDVLQRIAAMGTHSAVEGGQQISNTDWYMQSATHRTYLDPILQDIDRTVDQLHKSVYHEMPHCAFRPSIVNYWFQQYEAGDFHDWHVHNIMYAAVVFVELGEGAETRFRINGAEHRIPVEEGQILIFPGVVPHCSPPNKTGKRKTAIAINISTL